MKKTEMKSEAHKFMEKYGDVTCSNLPHFMKISEAKEAIYKISGSIGERLIPPPGQSETVESVVGRAARGGDGDAKLLIKIGALRLLAE